ncbi:putative toxin-antitoxin system toxin component, PIN family [Candidatus Woesebacteria bacterium RIFCSPHIGHO2_02_FULL_38_9]|nr:MAG: putative toxin-antitoxin system toxin component, PIN family [Candidatus Woesebacteria bacterium RIFCSPHIGHO2_02_FULL_38_9]OGM58547.1 MAG: putative toxin-antitoxin system toxin component, PIN family [Candidatus Woesebacteria bacterium RIFCSPLOWO2_01_FULL_38_20]
MKKNQKFSKIKVLFNASVVLAGLRSPSGGSAKLLDYSEKREIDSCISEIIFDEIIRNAEKIDLTKSYIAEKCIKLFEKIIPSPSEKLVNKYKKIVIDEGDAHVLASYDEEKIKYLVTLDKKHLLILKGKIWGLKIVTPGELIQLLSK